MNVIKYIQEISGLEVVIGKLPGDRKKGLPLYLQKTSVIEIFIEGRRVILVIKKTIEGSTPDQLAKQKEVLEQYFEAIIVFCFDKIEAYQRQRLLKKRVSFIVPYKQMYIPSLFIDLRDFGIATATKNEKLRPASRLLLLYHIQKQTLEDIPLGQIIKLLPYSAMSISRAAEELTEAGLCRLAGNKTKVLKFLLDKRELWETALPLLCSPVKKTIYYGELTSDYLRIKSNETALVYYSNIAGKSMEVHAISIARYSELKKLKTNYLSGMESCIEVWHYDPGILASGFYVDPLSLYLSLMHDEDERIQIAIDDLLKRVKW